MKLFRNVIWNWWDIGILKWCCVLFGMVADAYFHTFVLQYMWIVLITAVILTIRPAFVYFKN